MAQEFPSIFPFLRYDDPSAALKWLVDVLGFEEHQVDRRADGSIQHVELRLGHGIVMFGAAGDDAMGMKSTRALGASSQGVYIVVADPDARFARAEAGGAEILFGLRDQDYGSREFAVRDPEGNIWSFGTYQPFRAAAQAQ
jgi:uncharacterized glyoxalase superfamily protein PhnB